jgi:hypothetical protein
MFYTRVGQPIAHRHFFAIQAFLKFVYKIISSIRKLNFILKRIFFCHWLIGEGGRGRGGEADTKII